MAERRTQVGIVGAGPSGLMLGHLLARQGIESVIVESRSQQYVIERVRAGVLEQGSVDLMKSARVASRLEREGLRHDGVYLAFGGRRHHVDMAGLTGGRAITIYGQNEVVRDLIDIVQAHGGALHFGAGATAATDLDSDRPTIHFTLNGEPVSLRCDFIAGCDGFHGICRGAIPEGLLRTYERVYPFGWLGILADAPPSSDELVYSRHDRGFALFSMRSTSITRLYLQCDPDEDIANWSDDRIWSELMTRLTTDDGWRPTEGRIIRKDITGMRSFVAEPMRYGRLFLAGDAAHIVPPTGAKGLNLALADVQRLADGLTDYYKTGRHDRLDAYSALGLRRAWRAQRFSWWMTTMFHKLADESPFDQRRQLADLEYLVTSRAAMTSLAESYVGTPFD